MSNLFTPLQLTGETVRLETLSPEHKAGLAEAINDGKLWEIFVTSVPHTDALDQFIAYGMSLPESNKGQVFVTIDQASGKVIGSSRFMNAMPIHQRLEIGFTFIAKSYQRTAVNTEAKLLMLSHAFEVLAINRVEFLTDYLNQASRNAILRLGAKQEGILRSHMMMADGRVRDSVLFSITKNEWPGVKQNLQHKLTRK